jgi:cation:H+ antiporter
MAVAWIQFFIASAAIVSSGFWLARYGDVIAEKTGLSGTWIGLITVATVTSLPELITGLSSVTLANAPDIAVGDVLGSCVFNLLLIAVLDFVHREAPIYRRASYGHILAGGFSVILIGIVVFSLLARDVVAVRLGNVGIYTPAIIVLYLVAVRAVFVKEKERATTPTLDLRYPDITFRQALLRYAAASFVVVIVGISLPFVAKTLAEEMGWSQSFVGTLLVAAATSLPEAATTLGALRIGAIDLAIANLFGSNLFNILVLAIDDLAFLGGPLLSHVSQAQALSGVSAMIMTGAAIVGVQYRPETRVFRLVGWVSLALLLTYILNALVLYLHGH